jgi:hypothetical protein
LYGGHHELYFEEESPEGLPSFKMFSRLRCDWLKSQLQLLRELLKLKIGFA